MPKVERVCACDHASCIQTRDRRNADVARDLRSPLKLDMIIANPPPSFPSKLVAGTRTSVKVIYVEPEALTPEFFMGRRVTPGAERGIMRREMPDAPGFEGVVGEEVRTAAVQ